VYVLFSPRHDTLAQSLTTVSFRDSASETLSEYFEKIGGREAIGAKRKRSRPSKTTGTNISEKLPNAKKQKLNSEPVIEKVKIIWNEGKVPAAGAAKEDKDGTGEDDGEETIPKTPAPKKGRGRPPKNKALETSQKRNDAFKNAPGIAPEKSTTLDESIAKKGRGRPPKSKQPDIAQADEGLAGSVAKKPQGRPPKNVGSTPSSGAKNTLEGTAVKRDRGRPSKIKESRNIEKESEEDRGDRESSALG
jgi:hypothetical protein